MTGGQLSAKSFGEIVGYSGNGTFTQIGGANTISNQLYLGYDIGSSGTYSLSGSGELTALYDNVGYSGTGIFTQSGGNNDLWNLTLGYNTGGIGIYGLSASGVLVASYTYVGYYGTGTLTQSGGSSTFGNVFLGYCAGSSGTYSLSGSGVLTATSEYIGNIPGSIIQSPGGARRFPADGWKQHDFKPIDWQQFTISAGRWYAANCRRHLREFGNSRRRQRSQRPHRRRGFLRRFDARDPRQYKFDEHQRQLRLAGNCIFRHAFRRNKRCWHRAYRGHPAGDPIGAGFHGLVFDSRSGDLPRNDCGQFRWHD